MPAITKAAVEELRAFRAPHCVTMYVPFIKPEGSRDPNPILLKNLLREAGKSLHDRNVRQDVISRTLARPRELLENGELRPAGRAGLALFMHEDFFRFYQMPDDSVRQSVRIGNTFYVRQLRNALDGGEHYFLLALSHNGTRFFTGDRYSLRTLKLAQLQGGVRETLRIDEFPQSRELHPLGSPLMHGKGSEGYHQQYEVSQTDKTMLLDYFRRIDAMICPFLKRRGQPLILAGVEYLLPLYRQANTYPYLLTVGITGNFDRTNVAALHAKAQKVLAPESVETASDTLHRVRKPVPQRFT